MKNQNGFTIVEIMIVIAIAGLIVSLVFVAAPALQRGGRDQARKTDVSLVNQAVISYQANNNRAIESAANLNTATGNITFGHYTQAAEAFSSTKGTMAILRLEKFSSIDKADLQPTVDELHVIPGAKCRNISKTKTAVNQSPGSGKYGDNTSDVKFSKLEAGSVRQYVLYYALENEAEMQCIAQ